MNKITSTIFKSSLVAFFFTQCLSLSFAQDFQISNIRVGGVGCPTEQTQIVLAPDASAASLIFAQFESRVPALATGPKVSPNISSLNCNIFLDIKLPAGKRLESLDINYDMRGFTSLEKGVQGNFKSFLVSKSGMGLERVPNAPDALIEKNWVLTGSLQEEDFTLSATKKINLLSQCARGSSNDVISIRLQHTLTSQITRGFENIAKGSITMDTSDINGGLKIKATTSSCRDTGGTGRNCRIVRIGNRSQQICE